MTHPLSPFRTGDVRGIYPDMINEEFVVNFAHAFRGSVSSQTIATGHDTRESSPSLYEALVQTLKETGARVVDLGVSPTELGYFASAQPDIDAAIIVTASHNPADYNGLKCVLEGGRGLTRELESIQNLMGRGYRHKPGNGSIQRAGTRDQYISFLADCFDNVEFEGRIAMNGVGGTATTVATELAERLGLETAWLPCPPTPDSDPGSAKNCRQMSQFMGEGDFRIGIGWDGDCDRTEFFDAMGNHMPPYYVIGYLVTEFLTRQPGSAIVHDTRLYWNTVDKIKELGGTAVISQTGQSYMGEKMRSSSAVYGGELSSHHYFSEFLGCDSGMMTLLKMLEFLQDSGTSFSNLINQQRASVQCTPEFSLAIRDVDEAFHELQKSYSPVALKVDSFDGLSFEMPGSWRFNIRQSRTEPLVRVNFECRGSTEPMLAEGQKVFSVLEPFRTDDPGWPDKLQLC